MSASSKSVKSDNSVFDSLTFAEVEVPAPPKPVTSLNPFTAKVTELVSAWDDENGRSKSAASVVVPNDAIDRLVRLIGLAVKSHDRSPRVVKDVADKTHTTLTFWAVNQITRNRKAKDAPVEAPVEPSPEANAEGPSEPSTDSSEAPSEAPAAS